MGSCWEAVKEVGERFRKDGNRTGERGVEVVADLSSSTEGDHSRARRGGGWDGRVQANKRARKRSGVGGHRPETATFPPSLAGWPFSQGFDSNLTMIFTRRSPQLFASAPHHKWRFYPLQPIRQDHRDNWPACILYLFRRGYLAKRMPQENQRIPLKIIRF